MKKIKLVLIVLSIIFYTQSYSQSGWYRVSDSVRYLWIEAIQMTSVNTGYACGAYYYSQNDKPQRAGIEYYLGAFLKTTNGGLNWQRTDDLKRNIDDVFFLNDLTGYFIGWNGPATGYYTGHIFKTTDGAVTWARHDSIQSGSFFKIRFFDLNTGMIAGKYGEAEFTTNGGVSWTNRGIWAYWSEPSGIWCLDANNWFVGDGSKLARTTNQGLNWIKNDSIRANSFYFFNQTTGIMSTSVPGNIYKTTNAGENWFIISNMNLSNSVWLTFTDANTGYVGRYGNYIINKTTNGGYNWVEQYVTSNQNLYAMSFVNNFTGFAAGTNGIIFRTTNGGSVFISNMSGEVPDKYELSQNYPNPFNQSSIINLQCSMKGMVTLKVYDISGREVQILVNEILNPGTYQVRFDGSGLSSGIYYYKLSVDNQPIAVKKMVMIK